TPARIASTAGLRPTIHSGLSPLRARLRLPLACAFCCAFCARLYALWCGRSSARGVGPRPFSRRRDRPPDPAVGFPLGRRRTAPRLLLFPGTVTLLWGRAERAAGRSRTPRS